MKIFSTFSLFDSITLHASRFDLHHFRARFKTTVPAYLTLMKTMYARHTTGVIIIGTTATSILSFLYFYHTRQILSDYDAIARLNIARKIIDSMTPGVGQLGGIWLPFPQILMVPFIFNDFLWHSGLAGSFVSMAAYIASGFFLYKTALLITKNRYGSFLAWFVFVSNINIQLLQSMALSESFFLWNMIMVIYFLTRWSKKQDLLNLLITSFFLVVITLTRYEGYFVFIGAFVTVFTLSVLSHVKDRNRKKVEGTMILFGTIASYGIVLWCIYCLLFYKDPLYWLHLYSGPKGQIITTTQSNALGYKAVSKSFLESFTTYSEVVMLMNGILISTVAVAGFAMLVLVTVYGKFRKGIHTRLLPVIIIGTAVYFFLIYGYQKNFIPDIEFPRITSTSIFHKSLNFTSYSNIRYGIVMAPLIAVFIAFFASKKKILAVVATSVIIFQLFTNVYTPLFLLFQLPKVWWYSIPKSVVWFQHHYNRGSILISANRHENFMFQTGLPYKNFIYEGSRSYWTTCLNTPEKYATWVIYNPTMEADAVNAFLTKNAHMQLQSRYQLIYQGDDLNFYKRKS